MRLCVCFLFFVLGLCLVFVCVYIYICVCVCVYSLCEFIISLGISEKCYVLGVIHHLTIFLLALRHRSLSLKGVQCSKDFLSAHHTPVGSCVNSHLLKEVLIHPSTLNLLTQPYFQSTTGPYTWYLSSCNVCS